MDESIIGNTSFSIFVMFENLEDISFRQLPLRAAFMASPPPSSAFPHHLKIDRPIVRPDTGVFRRANDRFYKAAMQEFERRRRNEHMLVLRMMNEPLDRAVLGGKGKLISRQILKSNLESERGIAAALIHDPWFNSQ
jgi:hypothetical protein